MSHFEIDHFVKTGLFDIHKFERIGHFEMDNFGKNHLKIWFLQDRSPRKWLTSKKVYFEK